MAALWKAGTILGVAWLIGLAATSFSIAEPIRIATWNIEHLRDLDDDGTAGKRNRRDFEYLARYAAILNADIIALQEVENEDAARALFGPRYRYFFSERSGSAQRVGIAVREHITVNDWSIFEELGLPQGRIRYGIDLSIQTEAGPIRFLAVHLKSACFEKPLSDSDDDCQTLRAQVPILEGWVDARVAEGVPFVVLGDFNRRFDREGWEPTGDWMGPELSDNDPPGAILHRATQFRKSECWGGRYPDFIDHILLDPRAARMVDPGSFRQIVFEESGAYEDRLSDHCPISIVLNPES